MDCGKKCRPTTEVKRCKSCYHINKSIGKLSKEDYKKQWQFQVKYGIDLGGFDVLWIAFKGKCGVCTNDLTMPTQTRGQKLSAACIDHNHTTGNIRGLLCGACNRAIGLLQDDKDVVYSAYEYLGGKNDRT